MIPTFLVLLAFWGEGGGGGGGGGVSGVGEGGGLVKVELVGVGGRKGIFLKGVHLELEVLNQVFPFELFWREGGKGDEGGKEKGWRQTMSSEKRRGGKEEREEKKKGEKNLPLYGFPIHRNFFHRHRFLAEAERKK